MANAIVSLEQSAGSVFTGLYCSLGSKNDPVTIVKKANTALAVGTALQMMGTGDVGTASAAILSLVTSNPNIDTAVALGLKNGLLIAFAEWQGLQAIASQLPFLSTTAEALVTNFAAGVTAGANAELLKYSTAANAAAQAKTT